MPEHIHHYIINPVIQLSVLICSPELSKPASSLYLHNLTGTLEAAIRATNAQYDQPEALERLDVRMLDLSPGDMGWDVFSLHYHVDGSIGTVSPQGGEESSQSSSCCPLQIFIWRFCSYAC